MAKKIVKAVKKVAKKAIVAVKKKVVKKKVVEIIPVSCGDCGGRGLRDQHTLCITCEGHGKI